MRRFGLVPLLALAAVPASAQVFNKETWIEINDKGLPWFIGIGGLRPLLTDGEKGPDHTLRAIDALGITWGTTVILKHEIKERRPRSKGRDSFPSFNAAIAFAAATVEADFHPEEAPYWYLGAAVFSVSRLILVKHYTHDVLAGAALGYLVGRASVSTPHGLVLRPLLGHGVGFEASWKF